MSHIVDNIIFEINVPDYPCILQGTVQPRLSGLLGTTQMSPDNRGPVKYSLL